MLSRLAVGLTKGAVVGLAIGYSLAVAGAAEVWTGYLGAALGGMLIALIAGRPLWAADSRVEVATKVVAGAILAPALLWPVRMYLNLPVLLDPSQWPGLEDLPSDAASSVGLFVVTALAIVVAALGAFFEVDDNGRAAGVKKATKKASRSGRLSAASPTDSAVAPAGTHDDPIEEAEVSAAPTTHKTRRS